MTHKDIYTKFMIEYDKANVTSSYPSLTEYEVATVLDKAYNALIAQKVTGNNLRRVGLEGDLKAVTDLHPLIKTDSISIDATNYGTNEFVGTLPTDFLYFIGGDVFTDTTIYDKDLTPTNNKSFPVNDRTLTNLPLHTKLVSHQMAENFIISANNMPWIKTPVCYIEGDKIYIVLDILK